MRPLPGLLLATVCAACPLLAAEAPPPGTAPAAAPRQGPVRVTTAPHGTLLVNGRGLFPIGFTMPPPPDAQTPWGRPALAELADAGATFLRTGPMARPWDDELLAREQLYLDGAAKVGLYCMTHLREFASVKENDPAEARLRDLVNRFKDHPALAVWKGVDEPAWGKHPIPPMLRARQIVKELDPNHPIWVVQAPRGTIDELRAYDPTYDVTGADVYPVSYPPGSHSNQANKSLSMVGDFTKKMMEVARPAPATAGGATPPPNPKPVWIVLQISFSGTIKPGKTLRMPTFPETRYMTYQAIANGARGIVYFGGHIEKSLPDRDRPHGWNWTHWHRVLRPVIEEIGSKSPLYPALLAPDSKLPIRCSDPKVEWLAREVDGDLFLIAAKREGTGDVVKDTAQATFTGLPATYALADVLYENPRKVEANDGQFKDWFAPFDVHVYHFKRTP